MKIAINQFAIKHGVTYLGQKDDDVHEFSGSIFLTEKEVQTDIILDLAVGIIELYHEEAKNGYVRDFDVWLESHYPIQQFQSKNKKAV